MNVCNGKELCCVKSGLKQSWGSEENCIKVKTEAASALHITPRTFVTTKLVGGKQGQKNFTLLTAKQGSRLHLPRGRHKGQRRLG